MPNLFVRENRIKIQAAFNLLRFLRKNDGHGNRAANPTNKLVLTKILKVPTPRSVTQWVELGKIENLHWTHQTAGQRLGKRLFGGPDQRAQRKLLGARGTCPISFDQGQLRSDGHQAVRVDLLDVDSHRMAGGKGKRHRDLIA